MHRIDTPTATPGQTFTEGSPTLGNPATVVSADWLNAVQQEVCAVVEATGLALVKADNTQLITALRLLLDGAAPVGEVRLGYYTAAPAGFVLANGALLSRAAFPRLWAHAQAVGMVISDGAWNTGPKGNFSSGDGSTNFRVPDLRGQFFRALGAGSTVDAARVLGSLQGDEIKSHAHTVNLQQLNSNSASGYGRLTTGDEAPEGVIPDIQTASTGGSETRPTNVALTAIIRA